MVKHAGLSTYGGDQAKMKTAQRLVKITLRQFPEFKFAGDTLEHIEVLEMLMSAN